MIRRYATVGARLDDEDVAAAVFLRNHAWRPEDLGYPAGDYILWDLLGEIDRAVADRANA